jgi:hypothetical protein
MKGLLRRLPPLETLIFTAGLIVSIAIGITAYNRYGMYGDGPGGPGFSREKDPVSGASRLVHETMTSEGRLRRIFGPGRAVVEIELDKDDDGNVEECVKLVNGQIAGIGFSTAQDGIIDAWAYRDADGQISRIEISTKRNHIVDRWEHYTNGVLTRVQVDADGDGKPDPAR